MNLKHTNEAHTYGITLLRISLGTMWVAHALLKLLVFTLPGTVDFVGEKMRSAVANRLRFRLHFIPRGFSAAQMPLKNFTK